MRTLVTVFILSLYLGFAQDDFVGFWTGEIGPGELNLGVEVSFQESAGGLAGSIVIPAQGSGTLELEIQEANDKTAVFSIVGVPGDPTFEAELVGDSMTGSFTQSGQNFEFALERQVEEVVQSMPVIDAYLGNWEGVIGEGAIDLNIGMVFEDAAGNMQASITIPAQGFEGLVKIEEISEGSITMLIQGIPGNPTFNGMLVGDLLEGTFTQGGQELDFNLKRTSEAITLERPQDPKEPLPYLSEDVRLDNNGIAIAGTLTLPEGEGPFTAVIMITGSGPQDRNESLAGHRPFLVISDALTRAGYAVLRTDDRGVRGTDGDLSQASYDDLSSDIVAGLEFLQSRDDIAQVGLFGHSEGGYLAPLVAAERDDVAFIISMAGPSVSGLEVLELQNRLIFEQEGATEEEIQAQIDYLRVLGDALNREAYVEAAVLTEARIKESFASAEPDELPGEVVQEQMLEAQVASIATPYFRNIMVFNPQPYLEQLEMPVLAFYGGKDIQVDATQNVEPLRSALANNEDFTIEVFDNLNHLMQPAETGNLDEYAEIAITVAPEVLELITTWLQERF